MKPSAILDTFIEEEGKSKYLYRKVQLRIVKEEET